MEPNPNENLTRFLKRFFSGTLLSRVSGLARDLAMAFAFGDHPSVAAFMVAFRFSNLFRRLLGEGPLQSAFIPHFEGLRLQDKERAAFFFRRLVMLVGTILVFVTLIFEASMALFIANNEILHLTALLLPGIIFICLYGINISLLNCCDSFFIPSVAPAVCNLIWVASALYLRSSDPTLSMPSLAAWVVVGLFAQWLLTLPLTIKHSGFPWKDGINFTIPKEVKDLIKSFSLGAIGVGAVQINAFADALFARYADLSGPAYLWYSIRLEQLVLAIFGIACVSTITPRLSRAIKGGQLDMAQSLFSLSFKRIMFFMIPSTFACLALGFSSVNLIYGRGSFSTLAVQKTAYCLWAYSLGLVPTILVILFSAIFYAQNNFKLPMQISVLTVLINLIFNYIFVFVFQLGAISTALTTSICAWINCSILMVLVRQMGWKNSLPFRQIFDLIVTSLLAALLAASLDHYFFGQALHRKFTFQIYSFLLQSLGFFSLLFAYIILFKRQKALELKI